MKSNFFAFVAFTLCSGIAAFSNQAQGSIEVQKLFDCTFRQGDQRVSHSSNTWKSGENKPNAGNNMGVVWLVLDQESGTTLNAIIDIDYYRVEVYKLKTAEMDGEKFSKRTTVLKTSGLHLNAEGIEFEVGGKMTFLSCSVTIQK